MVNRISEGDSWTAGWTTAETLAWDCVQIRDCAHPAWQDWQVQLERPLDELSLAARWSNHSPLSTVPANPCVVGVW